MSAIPIRGPWVPFSGNALERRAAIATVGCPRCLAPRGRGCLVDARHADAICASRWNAATAILRTQRCDACDDPTRGRGYVVSCACARGFHGLCDGCIVVVWRVEKTRPQADTEAPYCPGTPEGRAAWRLDLETA